MGDDYYPNGGRIITQMGGREIIYTYWIIVDNDYFRNSNTLSSYEYRSQTPIIYWPASR